MKFLKSSKHLVNIALNKIGNQMDIKNVSKVFFLDSSFLVHPISLTFTKKDFRLLIQRLQSQITLACSVVLNMGVDPSGTVGGGDASPPII